MIFNFFLNPISYLVVLEYLIFSVVALWIVDAIFLAMLFTCCREECKANMETCCKIGKLILAFLVAVTTNGLYIFGWNFINGYFHDNRPQASDILRLIPVIVTSLLGWYSRDDLLEVFNNILPKRSLPPAGHQPAGINQQAINHQGINHQGINQQAINQQAIIQQGINQQGINQQAINQQAIIQQGINQQGINRYQQCINHCHQKHHYHWQFYHQLPLPKDLLLPEDLPPSGHH